VNRVFRGESLDRIVAAVLSVAALVVFITGDATPGLPLGLGIPLGLAMTGSVALRRRYPLAVGVFLILSMNLMFLVGAHVYSPPLSVAWMCGLYAIAVWTDTRGFVIGMGALALSNLIAAAGPVVTMSSAIFFFVVPGLATLIARRAIRERQLLAESLAARAELLEREQELRANEAVAEERARIARELHDLVAHNVSVMVVQAGVERHALPDGESSTRDTLTSIEQAGRQALVEARRLLGVLRRNGDRAEDLEPQPSVEEVGLLVEQVERAGLPVRLDIKGERVPLPAGVDLCAYRIVQEALTNALKHAGPAHAEVVLRYADDGLDIEVRDDGAGQLNANGDGGGHGLIGMRERVSLYGGRLETGPRDSGGFEVRAHLPLA